jgi:hypothetical protein
MRRATIPLLLLLTGCASSTEMGNKPTSGVVHSSCGAAEGGALHMALDANDHFLVVHADGSWGRGGDQGWTLAENAPDFSVLICDQNASSCASAQSARLTITSTSSTRVDGKISYAAESGPHELSFRAVRTDAKAPFGFCG